MLLKRIIENLKSQRWLELWLELVVVVVGIFLAFQVDRWYDDRIRRAAVLDNLSGLAADFAANKDALLHAQQRHLRSKDAIEELLFLDPDKVDALAHDEFYQHVSDTLEAHSFWVTRRTYDSLIAAGLVEIIPSEELKVAIAGFYQLVDRIEGAQEDNRRVFVSILEPHVASNLDYAAAMAFRHPEAVRMRPLRSTEQFRDVIRSTEFQGVLMIRWHLAHDLLGQYATAIKQVDVIDQLIQELMDQET